MTSRIALVTGGTSGVGKAIATGLARQGFRVVITSRSRERGEEVADWIRRQTDNDAVDVAVLDLASLDAVRQFSAWFKDTYGALHMLSNNAAVLVTTRRFTSDGFEMIFGVNYLSHFLLTLSVVDLLKASAPARVLCVSGTPWIIGLGCGKYDGLETGQRFHFLWTTIRTAAAKTVFALELADRLSGTGVTSNTFHPGLVRSGMSRELPWMLRRPFDLVQGVFFSETCPTGIYAACSSEVEGETGQFFVHQKSLPTHRLKKYRDGSEKLWENSVSLTNMDVNGKGKHGCPRSP